MDNRRSLPAYLTLAFAAAAIALLALLPASNPLRLRADLMPVWLHTLMEFASVGVCMAIFAVAWHANRPRHPGSIAVLACGFLAVALLDTAHTLSYPGMPDFVTPASPQKSISFWLVARHVEALTLLYVGFAPWRPFEREDTRYWLLGATLAGVAAAIALLLAGPPGLMPEFFSPARGLTPAKLAAEWIAIAVTVVATLRLYLVARTIRTFDPGGIVAAGGLMALASIALGLYSNVHDVFSLAGHACKVAGFYIVYRLVFVASVREPYERLQRETTARETAQQHALTLQHVDPITGLPNRAQLQERLAAGFAGGGKRPDALLLLDLDGFSTLNDLNGHGFGDGVLRLVGERLAAHGAKAGNAYRMGGDEFAVLLDQAPDEASAREAAAALARTLAAPMRLFGLELVVTASMGIALASGAGTAEGLARNASTALRQAKDAAPGGCRVHDATMDARISERASLRADLRGALERGELRVHYQPQVDLASGRVIGAEALARWTHPARGEVAPGRFIPEAEESGQIVELGGWVLDEACRQAAAWRGEGLELATLAVNLSARQFQAEDVTRRVSRALEASGLPAGVLEIELTESVLIHDTETMLAALRSLKGLGVRLAVDDFGTGYSSLAYLHAFPLDKLKIDQSFVRELGRRAESQVVVRAIVQLARALALAPVAEGVEDAASAALLAEMGCVEAQGYHFARPMPAADFLAFARSRGDRGDRREAKIA